MFSKTPLFKLYLFILHSFHSVLCYIFFSKKIYHLSSCYSTIAYSFIFFYYHQKLFLNQEIKITILFISNCSSILKPFIFPIHTILKSLLSNTSLKTEVIKFLYISFSFVQWYKSNNSSEDK